MTVNHWVTGSSPVRGANRSIAQSGSAPALGAGCREFESLYSDHFLSSPCNGGRSSVGRAPDCDSGGRGFKPHRPPHYTDSRAVSSVGRAVDF